MGGLRNIYLLPQVSPRVSEHLFFHMQYLSRRQDQYILHLFLFRLIYQQKQSQIQPQLTATDKLKTVILTEISLLTTADQLIKMVEKKLEQVMRVHFDDR